MKIIIVADSEQKQGGTNEVIKQIMKALDNNENQIVLNYIDREKYLPRYLSKRLIDLFRIFYLHNISKDSYFKQFDLAITLQPDSHCIRNKNHVIYFQHHLRQYYDLFWYSFRQRKQLRKKISFLILTAMNRLSDKIYLTSNLKKARIIVNSRTVGERLKKYNKISNFTVINPACNLLSNQARTLKNHDVADFVNNFTNKNNPASPVILSFSRLNVIQKGIDLILDTAQLMPNCYFIIAGPYDITLEKINKNSISKNINLLVKDFSEHEKMFLFEKCDVFLAPYIYEDFGMTPIEANAHGKPVVYCDDSGDIVYTQRHKITGYMSKRDPKKLLEAIQYCILNKEIMRDSCFGNALNYTGESFEASFRDFLFK